MFRPSGARVPSWRCARDIATKKAHSTNSKEARSFNLFSLPPHTCQPKIPAEANVIARRAPIPLFGAGLIEGIADETIAAAVDPEDRNGDGIRGRASRITDVVTGQPRIGRFGWKAQHATLLAFSGDAYRNEMGITNDLFREEDARGFSAEQLKLCSATRGMEDIRDRRTGLRGIDNFANFMGFLAPIERSALSSAARAGEALFNSIGCSSCHTPIMTTDVNRNPIFDRKSVPLYSDLLLHDVGTGDGILRGHPKAAISGHFKTGHFGERESKPEASRKSC